MPALPHHSSTHKRRQERPRFLAEELYKEAAAQFNTYEADSWLGTLRLTISPFMFWPFTIVVTLSLLLTIYVQHAASPEVIEMIDLIEIPPRGHVMLGGALGFLLVFRTNSSYERWWEARCQWATTIEACRNLAVRCAPALHGTAAQKEFMCTLMRLVVSFKNHLREEPTSQKELGSLTAWKPFEALNAATCPPLLAVGHIQRSIRLGARVAKLGATYAGETISFADLQCRHLITAVGACERIKDTAMTFGYVSTLRTFILVWLCTLPITFVRDYAWLTPPAIALIAHMFLSVEGMAIEIEQPFGDDPNDLPIEEYCLQLEAVLLELLPKEHDDPPRNTYDKAPLQVAADEDE